MSDVYTWHVRLCDKSMRAIRTIAFWNSFEAFINCAFEIVSRFWRERWVRVCVFWGVAFICEHWKRLSEWDILCEIGSEGGAIKHVGMLCCAAYIPAVELGDTLIRSMRSRIPRCNDKRVWACWFSAIFVSLSMRVPLSICVYMNMCSNEWSTDSCYLLTLRHNIILSWDLRVAVLYTAVITWYKLEFLGESLLNWQFELQNVQI